MIHTLYTLGYQNVKSVEELQKIVLKLDAVLVDIRFSPFSRDAKWAKKSISDSIPSYLWMKDAGNVNYKGIGIELFSESKAKLALSKLLREKNVIILCACWDVKVCHRAYVSRMLGFEPQEADKVYRFLIDAETPKQESFF